MTSKIPVGGKIMAVVLSGALVILLAGRAQAADDWDVDHLPAWASDPKTLATSIESFPIDGSVEDLETTGRDSGETVVTLNADILFEFAKAVLPATARARIASAVAKAPKRSAVSVGGHTDDVGGDPANLKLSQARAQAVASAVKAARPDLTLTVKGFGESRPVGGNGDSEGRSKNRRVEIRFAG